MLYKKIWRLLIQHSIDTVCSASRKIISAFPKTSCKKDLVQGPGVHSILCTCGQICIGQTGRYVGTILKEFKCNLSNNVAKNLTVEKHRSDRALNRPK